MPDINTNLQRLTNDSNEIESLVGDITNAIAENGGTVSPSGGLRGFPAAIGTIIPPINSVIENELTTYETIMNSGGITPTPVPAGTVRFIDYDGTVIASYGVLTFLSLTELPANPTHTGLTSQGWNWTLADAKTYVTTYGSLDIGQMYTTSDGKTRLHIRLGDGRLKPYLGLTGNSAGTAVSIGWGDGSVDESVTLDANTVYTPHEYSTSGDYTIIITVTNGSITLKSDGNYNSNILRKSSAPHAGNDQVYQNSLISIEIGNNVTSIGNNAFQKCTSLTSVTIPDGVTSIGGNTFNGCYSLTSVTIPDTVTTIDTNAFYYCYSLTSITIPNSVTSIEQYAFYYCNSLTSINIPNGVTSISDYTFYQCNSLTSINIPEGITSIGQYAFYQCNSLTSINIPEGITSIGQYAFSGCNSLTSINIPNGVTSIGERAFQQCNSLTSINIPEGITSIGQYAFSGCYALTTITIPDTVTSIGTYAFSSCYSLQSITIPDSVKSIGNNAFYYCYSLTSITIPDSVKSIGNNAFYSCYALTYITIPDTVTSIGSNAFYNCYGLGSIKFTSTTPPTVSSSNAWTNLPTDCKIYVPTGTLTAYTTATNYPSSSTYTYVEY